MLERVGTCWNVLDRVVLCWNSWVVVEDVGTCWNVLALLPFLLYVAVVIVDGACLLCRIKSRALIFVRRTWSCERGQGWLFRVVLRRLCWGVLERTRACWKLLPETCWDVLKRVTRTNKDSGIFT